MLLPFPLNCLSAIKKLLPGAETFPPLLHPHPWLILHSVVSWGSFQSIPSLNHCKEFLANLSRVSCSSKFFPRLVGSLRLQKSRCLANPSVTCIWYISLASGRNTAWSASSPRCSPGAAKGRAKGLFLKEPESAPLLRAQQRQGSPYYTPSWVDGALLWSREVISPEMWPWPAPNFHGIWWRSSEASFP